MAVSSAASIPQQFAYFCTAAHIESDGRHSAAHRVVAYLEEEAVHSYTEYLAGVDNGTHANVPAPRIATVYLKLAPDVRLHDVIIAVHANEIGHREVNHELADMLG